MNYHQNTINHLLKEHKNSHHNNTNKTGWVILITLPIYTWIKKINTGSHL